MDRSGTESDTTPGVEDEEGRWELLRALGSFALDPPAQSARLAASLALPAWEPADHTQLFVLELPPYASIHLGAEGKLGGEGADRVAGVWRTLGLDAPSDPDHLGAILLLYAELGSAALGSRAAGTRQRLDHARTAVLWEHLWSWVPGYCDAAVEELEAARPWAQLLRGALEREAARCRPAALLPLALRSAPPPMAAGEALDELLDGLVAPVRSGFVLTRADLARAAGGLELGLRRGERRFVLKALVDQDSTGTFAWLSGHARRWAQLHRGRMPVGSDPGPWWADRAERTAALLTAARPPLG